VTEAGPDADTGSTLAVFAATALPGDASYAKVLTAAGTLFARKDVHIVCLLEDGVYCRPLVKAALAAGGAVTLLSDGDDTATLARGCTVERWPEEEQRFERMAELADAIVGLPAGMPAVRAMFNVWLAGGGGASGKPIALLNRNRAYEALRGFFVDVVTHSLADSDRLVLFADTVEDLWSALEPALAKE